ALGSWYTMGELLGKGCFVSVYAAIRKEDRKEVSVLHHPYKTNSTPQQLLVSTVHV
ncbi:MAP/microtubule affinity-regulating kinase 3-like, partial [Tachysurus ichikawai]